MALAYLGWTCTFLGNVPRINIEKITNVMPVFSEIHSKPEYISINYFPAFLKLYFDSLKDEYSYCDDKRERRLQTAFLSLMLDIAEYHRNICNDPNHAFRACEEPIISRKTKPNGQLAALHSDIAMIEMKNENNFVVAMIELKEKLKKLCNIFENLKSDGNALGQLLHAVVLAKLDGRLVQHKPVILALASTEIWHCFLVKFDDIVEVVHYMPYLAGK